MKHEFILQMRPSFGREEKEAICSYLDEGGFITEYKKTEQFERVIAEYTGSKHCVVVNNGTISLTLAALALGLKVGDEVIVPNYTMIATPNSMKMVGLVPKFVDVEPETLCMSLDSVKAAITNRTKAIILVSANGRFPKVGIGQYEQLAISHGLMLIEDAAQALGSFFPDGRHVGRAGIVGSFSFSAPKIISTGQGGALVTDNDEIAKNIRQLKDFGRNGGGTDLHDKIGYNFKFTDIQACIGIEQFKKLPDRVVRKKEIWSQYNESLKDVAEIRLFEHNLEFTTPWFIDSMVDDRVGLKIFLEKKGIGTRVMYPPINRQKAYGSSGEFPVSVDVGGNGLWLPSYVQLSDEDINYICKNIANYYGY